MNGLTVFNFQESELRTVTDEKGDPWFVAKDICDILGVQNTTQAMASLDEDERAMLNIGRQGEVNIVSESGAFTLILRCRDAVKEGTAPHAFRRFVTSEVLPAIRKTGGYKSTAKKRAPRPSIPHKQAHDIIKYEMQIGKLLGTDAPMAKAIAVEDARRETGLDFSKLLPLAEMKEIPVGIRKIAPLAGVKERQASDALLALGLGEKDDKGQWSLTEKGKKLKAGSMEPFKSQHSEHVGHTCKWFESVVVPLIKQHIIASTSN